MARYVLIAGAGDVGFFLASTLQKSGYLVGIIERDPDRAAKVAQDLNLTVVVGDATEPETLREADAAEARYLVALTNSDAGNLAICQMAKHGFGVKECIARVIDPHNTELFRRLGVDATVSTTTVVAETIEKALPSNGMRLSPIFSQGDVELAELEIGAASKAANRQLSEIALPMDCLLIAILREGEVSFPRGKTVFQEKDRVFALTRRTSEDSLKEALLGRST